MDDRDGEAALCALLARLTDADDPRLADRAIALFLDRFGEDRDARVRAVSRLAAALMRIESPETELVSEAIGRALARQG